MSDDWIEAWLGTPRFQKYLDLCAGDHSRALTLYEWNVALGQALMHDIAHFEIALRNAGLKDTSCWSDWDFSLCWCGKVWVLVGGGQL